MKVRHLGNFPEYRKGPLMKYYKYEGQALRNIPNEVEGRGLRKYCKILYFKTK